MKTLIGGSGNLLPGDDGDNGLEEKVNQALDKVRPFLRSHGGNVELLGVRGRIARLQLKGACHGCSSSLITLKNGIEKVLHENVPELAGIEVAGLTDSPVGGKPKKWLPLLYWFDLKDGEFSKVKIFEEEVLVCAVDQRAFAFKNCCPAGHQSLEQATLEGLFVRCPCHGYRFDLRSGRIADDAPEFQHSEGGTPATKLRLRLEVLPVTLEDGIVKVGI